ncbi:MAG: class II fumarate hydratase [Nitrososphaerales archaeon]
MVNSSFRTEKDSLGEVKVPEEAYYGVQTQRAVDNFRISGFRFDRYFIKALGLIKLAAAKANVDLSLLPSDKGEVITKACQEVVDGKFDDQFVVDVFQTGSGTSTNMNANEVIASRAAEFLGAKRGDKGAVHPNDHVNMCQSTNDVFPTAIHIAAIDAIEEQLLPSLQALHDALRDKSEEFSDVVKAGRTHLQDAVPVTLGQEFGGYASMVKHGLERINQAKKDLNELPLGGTATGTGLNAHPDYAEIAIKYLNSLTGMSLRRAENAFEAMQSKDACVAISGALKTVAVSLMKISNDLRLLNSGPWTGFGEIELPAVQPGSSIMPGKVNPVIPEAVNQVAAKVMGNDASITNAGQLGQLELNVMMPVIAYSLLESIKLEAAASKTLAKNCVSGIKANIERCLKHGESSLALVTAIAPVIGYDASARVAKKALETGTSIREIMLEEGIVDKDRIDDILNLKKLAEGGRIEEGS